jgi:transposase InsO family protein
MDGRGRFSDNIFVERLWRSLKYEDVYLKAYQDVGEARRSIAAYFEFYNYERLHQALGYRTPRQVFEEALQVAKLRRRRKTASANHELAAQYGGIQSTPPLDLYLKMR